MRANLRLPGHDGTTLVADAYPAAHGLPSPVIVTRTPYDRAAHRAEGLTWARRGLGYVVQDVRGRYGSNGTWEPYRHERGDGAALVGWITAQPWCDGRIVTLGGSYGAYTAWATAVERPAAVRAVISLGPAMGLARVKFDRSGILRLAEHATWWAERAEARTSRTGLAAAMFADDPGLIFHLPVADLPSRMWPELHRWTDAIDLGPAHADDEAVRDKELAALPAATLHIGGWYDLLLDETLHQWHTAGSAMASRPHRSLLIGPWDHDLGHGASTTVGSRDHGADARIAIGEHLLGWLKTVLNGAEPDPAARVFVIGHGWSDRADWPPPTTAQTWHGHHDGTFDREPGPAGVTYRYEPADPYPSADPAANRTALIAARSDAAGFLSAPLAAAMEIAGAPVAHLEATGTDLIVRLLECTPSGEAITIAQGAVDTVRTGPGPYRLAMDPVAIRVAAGSRLRAEVTSSDFPLLARPLGEADRYRGTDLTAGEVHVHRVSIDLPVRED